jgi:outer membrane usher protein FimD/PapC
MTSARRRSVAKFVVALIPGLTLLASMTHGDETAALGGVNPLPAGYNFSYDRDRWSDQFSVFQVSMTDDYGSLSSSAAASVDPRLKPLTRLDTALNFSSPWLHLPTRLGDTVSSSAFWDQPVRMGGLQIGTLQPDLPPIITPAELLEPSILDGAAGYTLPVNALSNRLIEHVNSVAHLEHEFPIDRGESAYSIELGKVRDDFELKSNSYGTWLTSGTYRYGVTSATTLDGQFVQVGALQSVVGMGVLEGLGPLGQVSARVANSRDESGSGWLARFGYDYSRENLSIALRTHLQSSGYQNLGDMQLVEPLKQRTLASAGWDMGSMGKVSVASATQTYIDDSRRDVLALSHAIAIAGGGVLSTAAAYSPGEMAGSALLLSVSYPFGYWNAQSRGVMQQLDINLDKTIADALNQYRLPLSGHAIASGLSGQ